MRAVSRESVARVLLVLTPFLLLAIFFVAGRWIAQ